VPGFFITPGSMVSHGRSLLLSVTRGPMIIDPAWACRTLNVRSCSKYHSNDWLKQ